MDRRVHFDSKIEIFPVTERTRYSTVKGAFEDAEHEDIPSGRFARANITRSRVGGDGGSMADDLMGTVLDHQDFLRLNAVALDMTRPCWQQEASQISMGLVAFLLFLFFLMFLFLLIWLAIRTVEQSKTFRPKQCSYYKHLCGTWWTLPSGGLLLEYGDHSTKKSNRPLLFLHGNSKNLDVYGKALRMIDALGYRVFALEYSGYGNTEPGLVGNWLAPNAASLEVDLMEAWEICGSKHAIVMGFSLGGGLLGIGYPYLCPAPAQLVFLNTFGSFPALVEDSLSPCLASLVQPFMTMKWRTRGCSAFCGSVLIVRTKDDECVPCHHGQDLARRLECLDPVCVDLPTGGHVNAILCHQDLWVPSLLPPETCFT